MCFSVCPFTLPKMDPRFQCICRTFCCATNICRSISILLGKRTDGVGKILLNQDKNFLSRSSWCIQGGCHGSDQRNSSPCPNHIEIKKCSQKFRFTDDPRLKAFVHRNW